MNGRKEAIDIIKTSKKISSTQSWIQIETVLENGVIKTEDKYIKIIKILPINFSLKSELEKEAILNSYKLFLKTFNSKMQILIQSKKEDLSKHISCVKNHQKNENEKIKKISEKYISFINELNKNKKSSTKNYYIIIESKSYNKEVDNYENICCNELNEKYVKIKECLSRCGNMITEINEKAKIKNIYYYFFNTQNYF